MLVSRGIAARPHQQPPAVVALLVALTIGVGMLPDGARSMDGLVAQGPPSMTHAFCCQVCPEEFYDELSLLELPPATKLKALNNFHAHFGLPAIPAHVPVSTVLDAAPRGPRRGYVGTGGSTVPRRGASLIQQSEGVLGRVGLGLAHKKSGNGLEKTGYSRMKTGPPPGKFSGGACCPVCTGQFLPPTDYGDVTEPIGSTHVWGVSLLETETRRKSSRGFFKDTDPDVRASAARAAAATERLAQQEKQTRRDRNAAGTSSAGDEDSKYEAAKAAGSARFQAVRASREATGASTASAPDTPNPVVGCCPICVQQLYPPRDFVDVQQFLEIDAHGTATARSRGRTQLHTAHRHALFQRASSSSAAAKKGDVMINNMGASCSCRLCSQDMLGEYGNFMGQSLMKSSQMSKSGGAAYLQRPRNPMNKRTFN